MAYGVHLNIKLYLHGSLTRDKYHEIKKLQTTYGLCMLYKNSEKIEKN